MEIYIYLTILQIIGETIKNIPKEIKRKYKEIEWKKIAGLRDILIYAYAAIDQKLFGIL